jgi:hypothetical protein
MIKKLKSLTILLLITGAVFVYFTYDPATSSYFPGCPFYKMTELYCPGCGAQRATHYLLTGDITAAIRSNILLVIFLPFLGAYYGVQTFKYFYPRPNLNIAIVHKAWFIYGIAFLFIFYWIARNVAVLGSSFLAPH